MIKPGYHDSVTYFNGAEEITVEAVCVRSQGHYIYRIYEKYSNGEEFPVTHYNGNEYWTLAEASEYLDKCRQ